MTRAAFDAQAPALEPDLTRPLPRSLRALSFHDFRVFWVGAIGSSIGNNMQLAALLWVVAVATRSAAKVTLIAFITVVPRPAPATTARGTPPRGAGAHTPATRP